MDKPQQYISSGINSFTTGIDEFFSDEKIEYETNGSYIRLTGDMIFSEGGSIGFTGSTKGKIELPNTQRRLKLVFESDPNEQRDDLERKLNSNPVDAAQDKSYFAGIEGLWGEYKYWKFRPGIGLKVNSELEFFARLRANRLYHINENWQAYLRNTLINFNDSGYRFDSALELDNKINETLLFRSSSAAELTEGIEFWELSQTFSLTQSTGKKGAVIYQFGIFGVNEPRVFATDYLLQLRYRKKLHSNYLFLELSPKIVYQRENDFEPEFSFIVRGEIIFKAQKTR